MALAHLQGGRHTPQVPPGEADASVAGERETKPPFPFVTLAQTLTNDGNRGDSSSPPDIWRGCHHPFITLNKEHRQPKQAAAIPIAILSHNIDACKESARIIGSSRREVKPLLTDKPFNITPHNKPSTIQSFANNSDGRYPSPPAFGRGHYAPSPRSTKETVKDPGNSTLFSLRTC